MSKWLFPGFAGRRDSGGTRPRRAGRLPLRIEQLEGRTLLAALKITTGQGSGIADASGQIDKKSLPLGSAAISPSAQNAYNLAHAQLSDSDSSTTAEAGVGFTYQPSSGGGGTASAGLVIQFLTVATTAFPTGPTTVDAEGGTSLGGNPGDFITVEIEPGDGEHAGDPVQVTLAANAVVTPGGIPQLISQYQVRYNSGTGDTDLLSGQPVDTSKQTSDFRSAVFATAIGQTFTVAVRSFTKIVTSDPNFNDSGSTIVTLALSVAPKAPAAPPSGPASPAPAPAPSAPSGTVVYRKPVSDAALQAKLQELADAFGWTINVTSGDRTSRPKGSPKGSLHLAKRAADFHVAGVSDAEVFADLEADPELFGTGYQVIEHGPFTATTGPHIHLGHYADDSHPTDFWVEGLTKRGRGKYKPAP
jgi:hypothetical protein